VEVRDWAEGAACDENYRGFIRVLKDSGETMGREGIVFRVCEAFGEMGRGGHCGGGEGWEGVKERGI
jgi:hypothetical protein